jgi:hypothetical protein
MAKKIEKAPLPKANTQVVETEFAFTKENYTWFAAGFGLIILGFILMSGTEDIFSFRKIGLSSIVLLGGYIFNIFAIMKRPKSQ